MRVYLAAPYAARDQIKAYAQELTRIGINVTSTWLTDTNEITDGVLGAATDLDDTTVSKHVLSDFADIDEADTLVLFTGASVGLNPATAGSGGRHVETGYFIARRGPESVIVVGAPENVFHRARDVLVVPDWHEAVIELSARLVQAERHTPTPG